MGRWGGISSDASLPCLLDCCGGGGRAELEGKALNLPEPSALGFDQKNEVTDSGS